jgi:hypothetical protein
VKSTKYKRTILGQFLKKRLTQTDDLNINYSLLLNKPKYHQSISLGKSQASAN